MNQTDKKLNQIFIKSLFKQVGKLEQIHQKFSDFAKDHAHINEYKFTKEQVDGNLKIKYPNLKEKELESLIQKITNKAEWISPENKKRIIRYFNSFRKNNKNMELTYIIKFLGILLSIPFAEIMQDKNGTLNNFIYEHIIKFKDQLKALNIKSSFTPWQVPTPHIDSMIYSKKLEQQIYKLLNEKKAIEIVGKIIIDRIGIEKDLDVIFSRYNHRQLLVAEIAIIQTFLNLLHNLAQLIIHYWNDHKKINELFKRMHGNFHDIFQPPKGKPDPDNLINKKEEEYLKKAFENIFLIFQKEKEKTKLDLLKKIYNKWPYCTIDGGYGKEVFNALKCANHFFKINKTPIVRAIKEAKKLEEKIELIHKIIENNVKGNHSSIRKVFIAPTFDQNISNNFKRKEALLEKILQKDIRDEEELTLSILHELKGEKKFDDDVLRFLKKTVSKEIKEIDWIDHKPHIITFFRRSMFGNPICVNKYVHSAISAYWHIME